MSLTRPARVLVILTFLALLGEGALFFLNRGESQSSVLPLHSKRVLILGDEFFSSGSGTAITDKLSKLLGSDYEVVNVAVPENSSHRARLLIKEQLELYQPEVVLLAIGANDVPNVIPESDELLNWKPPAHSSRVRLAKWGGETQSAISSWWLNVRNGTALRLGIGDSAENKDNLKKEIRNWDLMEQAKNYSGLWNRLQQGRLEGSHALSCLSIAHLFELSTFLNHPDSARYELETKNCIRAMESKGDGYRFDLSHVFGRAAVASRRMGKFQEERQYLLKAVQADPLNSRAESDLGWSYLRDGRCFDAIRPMELAIRNGVPWPISIRALVTCYMKEHRVQDGIAFFEEIAKFQSGQSAVQDALDELLSLSENTTSKLRVLTKGKKDLARIKSGQSLLARNLEPSLSEFPVNQVFYNEILNTVLSYGARVMLVQPPGFQARAEIAALAKQSPAVRFLDLTAIEFNGKKVSAAKALTTNFRGLRPAGEDVAVEELASFIRSGMGEPGQKRIP